MLRFSFGFHLRFLPSQAPPSARNCIPDRRSHSSLLGHGSCLVSDFSSGTVFKTSNPVWLPRIEAPPPTQKRQQIVMNEEEESWQMPDSYGDLLTEFAIGHSSGSNSRQGVSWTRAAPSSAETLRSNVRSAVAPARRVADTINRSGRPGPPPEVAAAASSRSSDPDSRVFRQRGESSSIRVRSSPNSAPGPKPVPRSFPEDETRPVVRLAFQ